MGGQGRSDSHIVAVAVACGLEPWILADFDSADHALREPYLSPCNVLNLTHYRGSTKPVLVLTSPRSPQVFSRYGGRHCPLSRFSNRRSPPAVSQKRMAAQRPSTLCFIRPGVWRLPSPSRTRRASQAQITSLPFIAL